MRYVIVGNGIAGITAAADLRQRDTRASIAIISRESDHFFSRTALMYEFAGQLCRTDLEPYPRNYYEQMNFQRVSALVTAIDTENKHVIIENMDPVPYDCLLVASGSRARVPDWQPDRVAGIGHFVTLQDLDWLKKAAIEARRRSGRAAVVGGGLIGVEVSEILLHAGLEVDFIVREDWYWPVALNRTESQFVAEHITQHGCSVLINTEVAEVLQTGNYITGVRLTDGREREASLLVSAIGVVPNTSFLSDSGIQLSADRYQGVLVDEHMESSVAGVYAAGDCASVRWADGSIRPQQLWYTARDQGRCAALNMLGEAISYNRGPLYNSAKFFDIEYTTAGSVNMPLEQGREWYQKVPGLPVSQRIVCQGDTVVGFNMLGSRWNHEYFLKWIAGKKSLDYVLGHLHSAQFDAEFSPRFTVLSDASVYLLQQGE